MKLQLIRNATMKITYAGRTILTDPMLSPKYAVRSFAGVSKNPTVELPFSLEDVVNGVEGVVVTHCHPDHFDEAASAAVPKGIPVFCQPGDDLRFADEGFRSVTSIINSHTWQGITITRTEGRHGRGKVLERMGNVSGFVFQADGEPIVYWAGDSIWCEARGKRHKNVQAGRRHHPFRRCKAAGFRSSHHHGCSTDPRGARCIRECYRRCRAHGSLGPLRPSVAVRFADWPTRKASPLPAF